MFIEEPPLKYSLDKQDIEKTLPYRTFVAPNLRIEEISQSYNYVIK